MNVIGYTESGTIRVIFDGDEDESFVPDDIGNRHRAMIAEWEAEGNTIPSFQKVKPTNDKIREVPNTLFGGPQMKELFNADKNTN